ncbi:hypothetical protein MUK42_24080 [Musa troglodytarum]|uniref:Uncharacterized protein n=1 Tax=Musa troglodytarum TaxID=320322 RepID=A0A9E7K8U5_9LILI|nr:hypothetical protein MUK42_24080 [Musa troglodytarum]
MRAPVDGEKDGYFSPPYPIGMRLHLRRYMVTERWVFFSSVSYRDEASPAKIHGNTWIIIIKTFEEIS